MNRSPLKQEDVALNDQQNIDNTDVQENPTPDYMSGNITITNPDGEIVKNEKYSSDDYTRAYVEMTKRNFTKEQKEYVLKNMKAKADWEKEKALQEKIRRKREAEHKRKLKEKLAIQQKELSEKKRLAEEARNKEAEAATTDADFWKKDGVNRILHKNIRDKDQYKQDEDGRWYYKQFTSMGDMEGKKVYITDAINDTTDPMKKQGLIKLQEQLEKENRAKKEYLGEFAEESHYEQTKNNTISQTTHVGYDANGKPIVEDAEYYQSEGNWYKKGEQPKWIPNKGFEGEQGEDTLVEDEKLLYELNKNSKVPTVSGNFMKWKEGRMVSELTDIYSDYGNLSFDETGATGHYVLVRQWKPGEKGKKGAVPVASYEINANQWTGHYAKKEAEKFNEWIAKNHGGNESSFTETFESAVKLTEDQENAAVEDANDQFESYLNDVEVRDSNLRAFNEQRNSVIDSDEEMPYDANTSDMDFDTNNLYIPRMEIEPAVAESTYQPQTVIVSTDLDENQFQTVKQSISGAKKVIALKELAKQKEVNPNEIDQTSDEFIDLVASLEDNDPRVKEIVVDQLSGVKKAEAYEDNVAKFVDEEGDYTGFDTSWTETIGMLKSQDQEDLFNEYSEEYKDLNADLKREMKKHTLIGNRVEDITKEIDDIVKWGEALPGKIAEIKGREFKSQADVDQANIEIHELIAEAKYNEELHKSLFEERNSLGKTYNGILNKIGEMQLDSKSLELNIKALNRNYTGGAMLGHALVNSVAEMGQQAEEFVFRFNPMRLVIDDESPGWAKALMVAFPPTSLLALQAGYHSSREDREKARNSFDSWQEEFMDGVEKPQAFDDIDGMYDFGSWAAHMVGGQIPQLALMYATGGVSSAMNLGVWGTRLAVGGAMMVPSAGGAFLDMQDEMDRSKLPDGTYGVNYTPAQMYGIAMGTGLAEALSEQITFGQMQGALSLMDDSAKLGFKNYIKRGLVKNIASVGLDMASEGVSESCATIAQNYLNRYKGGKHSNQSIWEGVDESFVSGAMISAGMKGPLMKRMLVNAFESKDDNQKMGENSKRILEIQKLLDKPNLDPKLKKKYTEQIQDLVVDNNNIMANTIKKVDMLSKDEKSQLIDIESEIFELRDQAETIAQNEDLTPAEKKKEIDALRKKVDALENSKNNILAEYTQEEAEENYQIEKARIQKKVDAFNKRQQEEGGDGRTATLVETDTESIAESRSEDQAVIEAEIEANQEVLDNVDPNSEQAKIARNNIAYFQKQLETINDQTSQFGYISTDADGNSIMYVNKDINLANNRVTTPMHEFLHHALWSTIKKNPKTQQQMGQALGAWVMDNQSGIPNKWIRQVEAYDGTQQQGEEVITTLSEAIKNGDIEFNENMFTRLGDRVRRYFQQNYPDSQLGQIKFNTGRDVYNFIKDFNDSIEKGYESAAINRVIDKGAVGRLVDGKKQPKTQDKGEVYESRIYQETDKKYTDNKTRWGNEKIRKQLAAEMAYGLEGNVLDRLKNFKGITADKADIALEFISDQKRGLIGLIDGFDPTKMINKETGMPYESVSAYLNSKLPNGMSIMDARLLEFVQANPRYGDLVQSINQEGVAEKVDKQTKVDPVDDSSDSVIEREAKRLYVRSLTIPDGKIADLRNANPDLYNDIRTEVQNELDQLIKDKKAPKDAEINENEVNTRFVERVIANEVAKAGIDIKGLTYKNVKELMRGPLRPVLDIFANLYGIESDRILNDQDLNQEQRGAAQNWVLLNTEATISGLPEGHTASGKATGVPRTLLNMVNPETGKPNLLYDKKPRVKKKKTGSSAGLPIQVKQKSINSKHFQEGLGILRGQPNNMARGVDGLLRNLCMQSAMLATNQSIRMDALINETNPFSTIQMVGDGKSDLYFAKIPRVNDVDVELDSNVDPVLMERFFEFVEEHPSFKNNPHDAIKVLAEAISVPVSEFGNLPDFLEAEAEKYRMWNITPEQFAQVSPRITEDNWLEARNEDQAKGWKDYIKINPKMAEFGPYDFSKDNPNAAKDKAAYIASKIAWLKTLPTALLKNQMFLQSLQNGSKSDIFSIKDKSDGRYNIKNNIDEILANREANNDPGPETNIDWSKVAYSQTLYDNIEKITNRLQGQPSIKIAQEIQQELNKFEKKGVSQAETLLALKELLGLMNNHINEPGITKAERSKRGKMVSTTMQLQTNFKGGLFRGAAPLSAISKTPGKHGISPIASSVKTKLGARFGITNKLDAKIFSNIIAGVRSKPKGAKVADVNRVKKSVDKKLQDYIDKNGLDLTVDQFKDQLREEIVKPKERHDEHMYALFPFASTNFKNMIDKTFAENVDDQLRDYKRVALNEDVRVMVDALHGKTGTPFPTLDPMVRITEADPTAARDLLILDRGATLDEVVAMELALDAAKRGYVSLNINPLVERVEGALGENAPYFSKNTNVALDNIDARQAFDELIANSRNELDAKVAAIKLIKTMENINDINSIKNKLVKAYPDILNNNMTLNEQLQAVEVIDDAIMFSRKPGQKTQGASILDFDDTLAKTKSGVRAKIPNPDPTVPKPGRKVIFLAGGAGSGKSNVVNKLGLGQKGFKIVNSDISLEWLKKNHGLPEDMKDYTREQLSQLGKLQGESRRIAKRKKAKYQGNGDGVVIDGTGGSLNVMTKQVQEFKDKGYDVQMIFVETSEAVAIERNANRKERSLREDIVRKNHAAVQGNKDGFKKLFGDNFTEINTDNLDLDSPMPADAVEQIEEFTNSYENRRLDAEEFATEGADILAKGGKFDFSEFNVVTEGSKGPLFDKAMELQGKYGNKDMFVLTARPAESAPHIHDFLKAQGLNIPLENIVGLANSTPEAKALWIANKVGEGYNDIYFADDALQNVQAVQNVLDQMDVKSKVQQAKENYFSRISKDFNEILEETTGVSKFATFSDAKAQKRGAHKGKWNFFIPASAEDFKGLLYKFLGKGKKGEAQMDFFQKTLIDPFAKGVRSLDMMRQRLSTDLKALTKKYPKASKLLNKTIPTGDFTYDTAVRVYNWVKNGYDIDGLSKQDQKNMIKAVESNPELVALADGLDRMTGGYPGPGQYWMTETIPSDIYNMTEGDNRKAILDEFIQNRKEMFGDWKNGKLVGPNMNKIEAIYGKKFRDALEDMIYRMENGTNRNFGSNALTNRFANWVNNSVGAIMFFNMRSAVLQTLSTVNFINWSFNNPLRAAKAFANQPQFWKDFGMLFNSNMLKQRRSGLKTTVSHAELAEAASNSKNPVRAVFQYLLKVGFLPTQIADSFAIASGGATFYRNRVNDLVKQGVPKAKAEAQAFAEFQQTAEETQQSSRPDMISQQQASPLGRLILAFQNTPMQYARLMKKSILDLAAGRGDAKTHVSKIIYYGAVQNLIFNAMQKALFAVMPGGDEEEIKDKELNIANSMLDGFLRGMGVHGAVVATTKNMIIRYMKEQEKGYNADDAKVILEMLNLSPPVGSKVRKVYSGLKTLKFKGEEMEHMDTFDINNPMWNVIGNVVSGTTNIPLDRVVQKMVNINESLNQNNEAWQRIALIMGWNTWDIGVVPESFATAEKEVKELKKEAKKEKEKKKKEEEKKQKEKERKEREAREVQCSAHIRKGKGPRCKNRTENKNGKCYAHQ